MKQPDSSSDWILYHLTQKLCVLNLCWGIDILAADRWHQRGHFRWCDATFIRMPLCKKMHLFFFLFYFWQMCTYENDVQHEQMELSWSFVVRSFYVLGDIRFFSPLSVNEYLSLLIAQSFLWCYVCWHLSSLCTPGLLTGLNLSAICHLESAKKSGAVMYFWWSQ